MGGTVLRGRQNQFRVAICFRFAQIPQGALMDAIRSHYLRIRLYQSATATRSNITPFPINAHRMVGHLP
jgi:hypothetical protein